MKEWGKINGRGWFKELWEIEEGCLFRLQFGSDGRRDFGGYLEEEVCELDRIGVILMKYVLWEKVGSLGSF